MEPDVLGAVPEVPVAPVALEPVLRPEPLVAPVPLFMEPEVEPPVPEGAPVPAAPVLPLVEPPLVLLPVCATATPSAASKAAAAAVAVNFFWKFRMLISPD